MADGKQDQPRLQFIERVGIPGKLTKVWLVRSGEVFLGEVKWWAHWRRYCFFPAQASLFDASCLEEIAGFCTRQTLAQKESIQARPRFSPPRQSLSNGCATPPPASGSNR